MYLLLCHDGDDGKLLRSRTTAKVVFIGPCTAKKMEIRKETVAPYIDSALTFEELQAVLDSGSRHHAH